MLLTLATRSLASRISPRGEGRRHLTVMSLPEFTIRELRLRGLNIPASMLAGWSLDDLDGLRDQADKAGCPCLVLIEDSPLAFGHPDLEVRRSAVDRARRLVAAAHRLSCNALAVSCEGGDDDETFDRTANRIKEVIPEAERMEVNLLLAPHEGLTYQPERLTDLIKRVGGFRIGSFPSFGHAVETGDAVNTLRQLAPYAGAVQATVQGFTEAGEHNGYDLAEYVAAIRSVGFLNNLAIDYVGEDEPVKHIEKARLILEEAIEAEP